MPAPIVKDLKGPIATRLCATWSFASDRPDIQSLGLSMPRRCAQSAARRLPTESGVTFRICFARSISSLVAKGASNRLNSYVLKAQPLA
jgi:hypothetical protein